VVIVDEAYKAVIDTLVIGHMSVWGVDTHGFAEDFGQRSLRAHKIVVYLCCPTLVAIKYAFFKLGIECSGAVRLRCRRHGEPPS
jgi:hypothetical protein